MEQNILDLLQGKQEPTNNTAAAAPQSKWKTVR